ncbi:hypothetical protein EDD21DRAFT_357508 [Dissophora ornata]|nr:hypothetical protein EDD21DRAFT_357508 [Dissophora ornata]
MDSLPFEVLCIVLGYLDVLDEFRIAMVSRRMRSAAMSMIGATLADFTALPVATKDKFRVSGISPDNMKVIKRYRAIDVSRTNVTVGDIMGLIRCGIMVITIHQCFNIDTRSLLWDLRNYGAENPDVFVSLHTARSNILPFSGNIRIYDDNTPAHKYDLVMNMTQKPGECETVHCSYGMAPHRCCTECVGECVRAAPVETALIRSPCAPNVEPGYVWTVLVTIRVYNAMQWSDPGYWTSMRMVIQQNNMRHCGEVPDVPISGIPPSTYNIRQHR